MSRRWRIAIWVAAALLAVVVLAAIGLVTLVRSDWFFQQVKTRVVAELSKASGGKVELGDLTFDPNTLRVEASDIIVHGTETGSEEPLFRAGKVLIGLKLISIAKKQVDVESVTIDQPKVNLIIAADGSTNIPARPGPKSDQPIDEQILDLKIANFAVRDGAIQIASAGHPPRILPWNVKGGKLAAQVNYAALPARYTGSVAMEPVHAQYGNLGPIDTSVEFALLFERDHLQLTQGKLAFGSSRIGFNSDTRGFSNPKTTGGYNARIAVTEAARILKVTGSSQSGIVDATGEFAFGEAWRITGKLDAQDANYRGPDLTLQHVRLASNFSADEERLDFPNLRAWFSGGTLNAHATITALDHFWAKGTVANFDVNAAADIGRFQRPDLNVMFSGPFETSGSFSGVRSGRFDAKALLTLSQATGGIAAAGVVDAHYDGQRKYIDLAKSYITLPYTRADFSGGLGIAPGNQTGQLAVHAESSDLNDARRVALKLAELPIKLADGKAIFDGTVSGSFSSPAISGHLAVTNAIAREQKIDAFSADIAASSSQVRIQNGALAYQDMRTRVSGTMGLRDWVADSQSPLAGTLSLANAGIGNLLAIAGQKDIPIQGYLTADAQVNGTLADPRAAAVIHVGKGFAYGEPFDRAEANIAYVNGGRQEFRVEVNAGPAKLTATGNFQHSPEDFLAGTVQAHVVSNELALRQVEAIRSRQPTIGGTAHATGDFSLRLVHGASGESVSIVALTADAVTRDLSIEKKSLGDLHLTANNVGSAIPATVHTHLESNLAHATIHGDATWKLTGDYPGSGELTFDGVNLADVRRLLAPDSVALASVAGTTRGKVSFSGPALKFSAMTGTLEIPALAVVPDPASPTPIPASLKDLVIANEGPLRATMSDGVIRIESARVKARSTDITLSGSINVNAQQPLSLDARGSLDLSILPMFERDLISSGTVAAVATIRGSFDKPSFGGRVDVRNANLNLEGLPNGLSKANGTILFDGSRATIQTLSAETGGGHVELSGFAAFPGGALAFRVEAKAREVRVRYPEGVSTVANADLRLIGTPDRSTLSGSITVLRSSITPHTDLASVLNSASAPVQTPEIQTGLVGNMQFDVDVQTAPDVSFQTSLAQGLQADANLRLRGTVSNPVLLGRVNISQGELVFFGNKYTIDQGSISFYNPTKLDPVLDMNLVTKARGVDVTINVTGPATKLNVNYRSDPPLQFADLVALLATGRTPQNPTLAARDTGAPQTWQGMGANALLGEAIANPLAGRLQRFFGVSKIKIDPLLTGVGGGAQARLTIEQQVTPDLTFTYITNVNNSTGSAQVIRAEWNFSKYWSAVAVRDEYGYFGIDFQYRKRFK